MSLSRQTPLLISLFGLLTQSSCEIDSEITWPMTLPAPWPPRCSAGSIWQPL
jgi:hypothetical protein